MVQDKKNISCLQSDRTGLREDSAECIFEIAELIAVTMLAQSIYLMNFRKDSSCAHCKALRKLHTAAISATTIFRPFTRQSCQHLTRGVTSCCTHTRNTTLRGQSAIKVDLYIFSGGDHLIPFRHRAGLPPSPLKAVTRPYNARASLKYRDIDQC
ncbi:hypothetical protein SLE2022_325720 [Rubroshorea leprosula]